MVAFPGTWCTWPVLCEPLSALTVGANEGPVFSGEVEVANVVLVVYEKTVNVE